MAKAVGAASAAASREERLAAFASAGQWGDYERLLGGPPRWALPPRARSQSVVPGDMRLHELQYGMRDYEREVDEDIVKMELSPTVTGPDGRTVRRYLIESRVRSAMGVYPGAGAGTIAQLFVRQRFDLLRHLAQLHPRYLNCFDLSRQMPGAETDGNIDALRFICEESGNFPQVHRATIETAAWDARRLERTAVSAYLGGYLAGCPED
jgi:hypothetical protein